MAHLTKINPTPIPPLNLHLTPESEEENESTKRAASRVFEETVIKKARRGSEEKTTQVKKEAISAIVYDPLTSEDLSKALESKASLQVIKNILQNSVEVKNEHLCLALRHSFKEGLYLLIIAQARQEAWKNLQEKVKTLTQKELPSFPLISDKETLKIASFERWNEQGMQLLRQLKELSSTDSTQKGKECREDCILLISRLFDAFTGAKLTQLKELLNSCAFKNLRKIMQPVIQAVQKAYSQILILQLASYKQEDPDRKKVEHNFKLLLKVMVIPQELGIFALYAHLPPDSFRPLCQWFSEQDRLSLIDQACRSPCSLEHMIILFWRGDPERIVYSIVHLTPDSPLVEDAQIVTHIKTGIRSHAHVGVLEFLLHRMHQQHERVVDQLKASSSKVQGALTNYLTQLKEIFELGLQHSLSLQILQSLQKKIIQAHDKLHPGQGKAHDYFNQLFSKVLHEQAPMNGILTLLEIVHPSHNDLSQALKVVLKSLETEKTSWNWEDISKCVHTLIFQYHFQPSYLQLESFMKELCSLKTPEVNANLGFILETLNSLLHSAQPQERERLQKEFSKNRNLPREIVNKLSS